MEDAPASEESNSTEEQLPSKPAEVAVEEKTFFERINAPSKPAKSHMRKNKMKVKEQKTVDDDEE